MFTVLRGTFLTDYFFYSEYLSVEMTSGEIDKKIEFSYVSGIFYN